MASLRRDLSSEEVENCELVVDLYAQRNVNLIADNVIDIAIKLLTKYRRNETNDDSNDPKKQLLEAFDYWKDRYLAVKDVKSRSSKSEEVFSGEDIDVNDSHVFDIHF